MTKLSSSDSSVLKQNSYLFSPVFHPVSPWSNVSRPLTMLGTRDFGSDFRRRYFPGSSPKSLVFPRFHRSEFSRWRSGERKNIESQSATRDSVVSPGDSAVPARSFALVREIMNGHTKREAEPGGRNTLIMSQRREYGENKIRANVEPNRTWLAARAKYKTELTFTSGSKVCITV